MMNRSDFLAKLNLALNSKTMYVNGCFGSPLTSVNYSRWTQGTNAKRTSAIKSVLNQGYFGFDCVCLIKGILWGWNANPTLTYGGAIYGSNNIPDCTEDVMIGKCSGVSTVFSTIQAGEAVWIKGHIGVYIGDGKVIECTPQWDNCVQISGLGNVGATYNGKSRTWTKHGKLPWVEYEEETVPISGDTPSFGIDISRYQSGISLTQAKKEGVQFVILKAGGADAGYYKDRSFNNLYSAVKAENIPRGAYYFGQAFSTEEAKQEANHFISLLQGTDITKVFYDVEAKMLNQGKQHLTDIIKTFCDTMNGAGYVCGIYMSASPFRTQVDDAQLSAYPHWVASYSRSKPSIQNPILIWQFGGSTNLIRSNKVAGVVCDQNYLYQAGYFDSDYVANIPTGDNKTLETLVDEVLKGMWGNGEDRRNNLTKAGYDYAAVQKAVNEEMERRKNDTSKTIDQLANEVLAGVWGNNPLRRIKLLLAGYDYSAVQARVEEIVEQRKKERKTYVVVKGDTLSSIAKKYNTTVSALVKENGIADANKIQIGQVLVIA